MALASTSDSGDPIDPCLFSTHPQISQCITVPGLKKNITCVSSSPLSLPDVSLTVFKARGYRLETPLSGAGPPGYSDPRTLLG